MKVSIVEGACDKIEDMLDVFGGVVRKEYIIQQRLGIGKPHAIFREDNRLKILSLDRTYQATNK